MRRPAYTLTGETRKYNPARPPMAASCPTHPFSPDGGGWGALEIARPRQHDGPQQSARHCHRHRRRAADWSTRSP